MKRTIVLIVIICNYLLLSGQHANVLITKINSPEEPSICLSYANPQFMVAGANNNQYNYSADSGYTWTRGFLESSYGVAGDPCIVADNIGNFYYLHLSRPVGGGWLDRIVCQRSTDNGQTWNDGGFMGYSEENKDHDKQWATINFKTNHLYATWTQFDVYGSSSTSCKSNILFSKSTNFGESWSPAIQINELSGNCIDGDKTAEGAVPAIGPNGEIYVAWAYNDSIYFDKSLDDGETWLEHDIFVSDQPGGWDLSVPGIYRCNGLPVTACDTGNSPYNGTIYVNWTDQRNGSNNTDVWLAKSTNGGLNWSKPIRVNNDETVTHQFFTWMTIDQITGYVYFVFYDRRNHTDNYTDVFMAVSKDGGNSFNNFKVSESPFLPRDDVFFGDYNNITAHNGVIRPIWTRLHYSGAESGLSIWTAIIDETAVGIAEHDFFNVYEDVNYPNPATNLSFYSFKLRNDDCINLKLVDAMGKTVTIIINNEKLAAGKYIKEINLEALNLTQGLYFYQFYSDNEKKTKKLIVQ